MSSFSSRFRVLVVSGDRSRQNNPQRQSVSSVLWGFTMQCTREREERERARQSKKNVWSVPYPLQLPTPTHPQKPTCHPGAHLGAIHDSVPDTRDKRDRQGWQAGRPHLDPSWPILTHLDPSSSCNQGMMSSCHQRRPGSGYCGRIASRENPSDGRKQGSGVSGAQIRTDCW